MISFRELDVDDAEKILNWRLKDRVTKFMNTDVTHDLEAQRHWIVRNFNRQSYYNWIIQYSGQDVGFINFVDWDIENKTTSWGFYIGEESALGIGGVVPSCFYKFAFDVLCVESVNAEILYDNINVIKLHEIQGYKFDPSRDHVIRKNDSEVLVICMTLQKEIFSRKGYRELDVEFPVEKWNVQRKTGFHE